MFCILFELCTLVGVIAMCVMKIVVTCQPRVGFGFTKMAKQISLFGKHNPLKSTAAESAKSKGARLVKSMRKNVRGNLYNPGKTADRGYL